MKVKELFTEMAIAGYGDYQTDNHNLGYLSDIGLERYYDKIDDIKTDLGVLQLFKIKSNYHYILGRRIVKNTEDRFEVIFKISFSIIEAVLEKFHNVDLVETREEYRCYGLAIQMYRYFIKTLGFSLMGDEYQFFGARRLWAKLSKMVDATVDIINLSTNQYIEQNVIVHQGREDWDYDTRVWGKDYSSEKKDVRLILKDIVQVV